MAGSPASGQVSENEMLKVSHLFVRARTDG